MTNFTVPFNDTFFYLAANYSPGAGILAMQDLSALPGGIPSSTSPIRLSITRARDGAKTIVKCTGKAGNNLTGVTVIEGKTDIPLDAGDLAKVQLSAGYIVDLHTAVNALETSGGGAGTVTSVGLSLPIHFNVTNSPVTTSGNLTAVWNDENPNRVFAGPMTGGPGNPTFRQLVSDDLPTFAPSGPFTYGGAVPTPPLTSGTTKFLREDATWVDVPIPSDFTNTTHGLVPVPSPSGGSSKFLREDATWQEASDPQIITLQRTVSGTYNDCVEIGHFTGGNNEFNATIQIVLTGFGVSVAKSYMFSINYTGFAWAVATPIASAHTSVGDFSLEISQGYLRIRSLGAAGTAYVRIEWLGGLDVAFTPTAATSSQSPLTSAFSSMVFSGYPTPGIAYSQRLITLEAPTNPGVGFGQLGFVKLGRYDSTGGYSPHSRIVLAPTLDDMATDVDVLTVDSNGTVGSSGHIRANGGDTGAANPVTIAVDTGAGSGATSSITGSDQDGVLSVTTGTGTLSAAAVVNITFGTAFANTPRSVVLTAANDVTAALYGTSCPYIGSLSGSAWTIKSNSVALGTTTTYSWYYHVGG